jgi:hypothetical protein
MEADLVHRRNDLLETVAKQFDQTTEAGLLTTVRQTLNATKFINGLLRDLREE